MDTLLIAPEKGLLDGTIINDYTNKWKVTLITANGQNIPNKIWTDYGQVIDLNGENYFHRVQDLYDPQMKLQDTWINMVKHKDLIPISSSTFQPTGLFSFTAYEGAKAKFRSNISSGDSTTVESSIDYGRPVYDWSLYGMLLVGLPFEKGLVAKMPIAGTDSMQWLNIHVSNRETLVLPDGNEIDTWKIETNQRLIFWISESAPYVIQLELALQNNAKLVWEMF